MLGVSVFLVRTASLRAVLVIVYALSWVFLVLTKSKTSIGVAVPDDRRRATVLFPAQPRRRLARTRPDARRRGRVRWAGRRLPGRRHRRRSDPADLRRSHLQPAHADLGRRRQVDRRPALAGLRLRSFWEIGELLNPLKYAPWDAFYVDAQVINTAHSGYLDQLLQTGIVGLALGLAAILRCLYVLQATATRTRDRLERIALVGCLCIALCLILNNFLESYLFRTGDGLGYLFFVLMLQAEQTRLALRRGVGATRTRSLGRGREWRCPPAGQ